LPLSNAATEQRGLEVEIDRAILSSGGWGVVPGPCPDQGALARSFSKEGTVEGDRKGARAA